MPSLTLPDVRREGRETLKLQLAASLMREVLDELEAVIDAQVYDARLSCLPDEHVHTVTVRVTEKLVRQIGRALSAAEDAARVPVSAGE